MTNADTAYIPYTGLHIWRQNNLTHIVLVYFIFVASVVWHESFVFQNLKLACFCVGKLEKIVTHIIR